jgi:hypothetical protein
VLLKKDRVCAQNNIPVQADKMFSTVSPFCEVNTTIGAVLEIF